jgi:hypothetical protein
VEKTMHLDLSPDEARFLKAQLARHLAEVEDELVHTEARDLQTALATDLERLRTIEDRLAHLIEDRAQRS